MLLYVIISYVLTPEVYLSIYRESQDYPSLHFPLHDLCVLPVLIYYVIICDYILCSHSRSIFIYLLLYLFIVIFKNNLTFIYVCIHAYANKLSNILIIISGGQMSLRALLSFGHPTTTIIYALILVNYYIHVILYSW